MDECALHRPQEEIRRARFRVGQHVAKRWQLDALLGTSATAAIYSATHRSGKRVALKILHREFAHNEEVRERFLDEGRVANRIRHPGAANVLGGGVAKDGLVFLVMDLLEGESLATRLKRRRTLCPEEVLALADALLDVLAAGQHRAIVYRDFKPGNIFLSRDGSLKLFDYSSARASPPRRPPTNLSRTMVGTPALLLPEQARSRSDELDQRADLWAVGATMFMALSGRPVHEAQATHEAELGAMVRAAPSLAEVVPGLPPALVEVVDRALTFERNNRWPDARAMQAAVRRARMLLEAQRRGQAAFKPIDCTTTSRQGAFLPPHASSDVPPALSITPPTNVAPPRENRRRLLLLAAGMAASFFVTAFG